MKRKVLSLVMALLMVLGVMPAMESEAATTGQYTNPLMNGADPTIVRGDDGYFYSGFGTDNDIYIKRSESLLGLSTAESHLVWDNPNTGNPDNNSNYYIWGPYIYRIDGAWYIYYTSSTENDFGYGHPSCYVLENTSEDPFKGEWHLKGSNTNVDDFEGNATEKAGLMNTESYGLACGVISIGGEIYFTYTKYDYYANEPGHTKFNECPTIVKMENPWTLTGPECTVARPTYDWEKHGDNIDEGCAVVEHDGKVYFAYSVSSFTNDNYGVGLSVCDLSTDVMDENNWKKSTTPIVSRSDENASFGPGSPLFVKSPDGTEDWLIYHGGPIGGQTSTDRRVRAQIINWTDDGQISLGIPSNPDTVLDFPSGEIKSDVYEAEDADYDNVTKKLFNNTAKASGSGYMQYDLAGTGYVEFTVDSNSAGLYALGFRYNNTGDTAEALVTVNGADQRTVSFEKNANFKVDLDIKKVYNVMLQEGTNTIRVSVPGPSTLNLDTMIVTKTVKYEAEEAELLNGAFVENSDHAGGMYNENATVKFNVNVPTTGYYAVNLRYADGFSVSDGAKYATVFVNGEEVKKAQFFPTGSWNTFGTRIDNLYLNAGDNTIAYVNVKDNGANTGDVNYDFITVTEAVTHTYKAEAADEEITEIPDETVPEEQPDAEPENTEPSESEQVSDDTVSAGDVESAEPVTVTYEGETAELINGAFVEGGDHVGGMYNGFAAVKFHVNVEEDGIYAVEVGYANGHESDSKKTAVYVNGEMISAVDLPYTGPWNTWSSFSLNLPLTAGENIISFVNDRDSLGLAGDVNYDRLTVTAPKIGDLDSRVQTVRYEAELSGLSNGAVSETNNAGFSAVGFAGGMYNSNATVSYKVYAPAKGKYNIGIGYANGNGTKYGQLYVNGAFVKEAELPTSGGWSSYTSVTTDVDLEEGVNSISLANLQNETGNTGDVNYDYLELVLPAVEVINDEPEPVVTEPESDPAEEVSEETGDENGETTDPLKTVAVWNVAVESEALYDVTINYSNDSESGIYSLFVGDEKKADVKLESGRKTETVAVKLNAGSNEIKLVNSNVNADPNVGDIHLSRRIPWYYQAENATLKGVSQMNDHLYYDGTGFVGGFEDDGDSVSFLTKVSYSGTHTVSLKYSGAWSNDITISMYINGQKVKQLSLSPTSSWDSWNEATEKVYLRAGKNTVEFKRDGGDSGNFNIDECVVDKYSTGETTAEVGKLISGEVYVIRDKNSSLVADIDGYSPDAGREVHLWYYLGNNNQKWKLVDLGNGYYSFKGTYGSKRITIADDLRAFTADENSEDLGQQWKLEKVGDYYKLINRKYSAGGTEKVLTVKDDSKAAGASFTLEAYDGRDSQLFSVDGGLRHTTTEVREIQNVLRAEDFAAYGSQYVLVDPVIPEAYDPYTTVNDGMDLRYEAAKATLSDGARVEDEHSGFLSSTGYVGGMYNGNAAITFKVNVETPGNYTVSLGYCNGFGESKKAATFVNGEAVEGTALAPTGSWDTWGKTTFTLDLNSGVNTIVFMNKAELTDGIKGDVNYDYMDISKYPNTVVAEESLFTSAGENTKHFEAEEATLLGGAFLATDHHDYSGDGFVGGMYNGSAKVCLNVNAEEAGLYRFNIRYANGFGTDVEDKAAAVQVNGKFTEALVFDRTGSWDNWGTASIDIYLNEGMSTVAFANSSSLAGHAGDVNYDYIEVSKATEADDEPDEETPAETEDPDEEIPDEETPAEETPAGNAPSGNTPSGNTHAGNNSGSSNGHANASEQRNVSPLQNFVREILNNTPFEGRSVRDRVNVTEEIANELPIVDEAANEEADPEDALTNEENINVPDETVPEGDTFDGEDESTSVGDENVPTDAAVEGRSGVVTVALVAVFALAAAVAAGLYGYFRKKRV
ncbi:MAG: carbohydrate-binding protein [Acetatifactor sp.]|nr:carbohydrate-binding protein [Acetatifactor sp.]